MEYAVIKTGGKQYRIAKGDKLQVEKIEGEIGDKIKLDNVLMISTDEIQIGKPVIEKAYIQALIIEQLKAPKIKVFKKKRRKSYRRTIGHRQRKTALEVLSLNY